jgi:hypothetical protein
MRVLNLNLMMYHCIRKTILSGDGLSFIDCQPVPLNILFRDTVKLPLTDTSVVCVTVRFFGPIKCCAMYCHLYKTASSK